MNKLTKTIIAWGFPLAIVVLVATKVVFFRIDLTQEKRFSISKNTAELLQKVEKPIRVEIYLESGADPDLARLKHATHDMLEEFDIRSKARITYHDNYPSEAKNEQERNRNYIRLHQRGLIGMTTAERSKDGQITQKTVFPWAEVICEHDTFPVCLLQPQEMSFEANVNAAIAELEYQLVDAIRFTVQKEVGKVAFLEGHGELNEAETYDASETFSRYFQVDRGILGSDPSILNDYKAIIIAKPMQKFEEKDKFIIDQYIMQGGKVMWLLDVSEISQDELTHEGITPIMPLDLNLTDMLFRYGARIEPAAVQDRQCVSIPVNIARPDEAPRYQEVPWTYMPLLLTNPTNSITKNVSQVRSELPAFITMTSDENGIKMIPLLMTSNASHVDMLPNQINMSEIMQSDPQAYFNRQNLPVAASLEGSFPSIFTNRMVPAGIDGNPTIQQSSQPTKMVLIADGDIIRNEIHQDEQGISILPLGYNRMTGEQYGNRDFVLNALLYLTDDENWMNLRNRTLRLRMLNKANISTNRTFWQILNVGLPPLLLLIGGALFLMLRRINQKKLMKN